MNCQIKGKTFGQGRGSLSGLGVQVLTCWAGVVSALRIGPLIDCLIVGSAGIGAPTAAASRGAALSAVRRSPSTVDGWRPTSVVTHPPNNRDQARRRHRAVEQPCPERSEHDGNRRLIFQRIGAMEIAQHDLDGCKDRRHPRRHAEHGPRNRCSAATSPTMNPVDR